MDIYRFGGVLLERGLVVQLLDQDTGQLGVALADGTRILLNRRIFPDVKPGDTIDRGRIKWPEATPRQAYLNRDQDEHTVPGATVVIYSDDPTYRMRGIYNQFGSPHWDQQETSSGVQCVSRLSPATNDVIKVVQLEAGQEVSRWIGCRQAPGRRAILEFLPDEIDFEAFVRIWWLPRQTDVDIIQAYRVAQHRNRINLQKFLGKLYQEVTGSLPS